MTTESGAAGVVVATLVALAMVVCLLVVDVSRFVAARAQLTTAADAAALAAAPVTFAAFGTNGDPTRAAFEVAAANGAELMDCSCNLDHTWSTRRATVTVGVSIDLMLLGDLVLTSRGAAEFQPTALVDW